MCDVNGMRVGLELYALGEAQSYPGTGIVASSVAMVRCLGLSVSETVVDNLL